jgi:hypothetical protein
MRDVATWFRLGRVTASVHWHSKLRSILLSTLISVGVLVFLTVTELSRASTENLDDAIVTDLGATGTYRIEPSTDLGLPPAELIATVRRAVGDVMASPMTVVDALPPVHPECPPFDTLGDVATFVIRGELGEARPIERPTGTTIAADLCLAGLTVPDSAMRGTTKQEGRLMGGGIVIDPAYERLVQLTSTRPTRVLFIIRTGRDANLSDQILSSLRDALSDSARRAGLDPSNIVTVVRVDAGSQVRSASDGIRLVYLLIGWGVLLVGGLGVLVAELIVLRDRTWFFGLARAVGARRGDIAALVLNDIALVLAVGFAVGAVVATLIQPLVDSLGQTAFGTDLRLLRVDAAPRLVAGAGLMLAVGGAYPAWQATRLDPVEVLERR